MLAVSDENGSTRYFPKLNDEILIGPELIDYMHWALKIPVTGLVGPAADAHYEQKGPMRMFATYYRPQGYGQAMFLRRKDCSGIPEQL